jgi:hypothetical protein
VVKTQGDGVACPCVADGVAVPGNVEFGEKTHEVFWASAFGDVHHAEAERAWFLDESQFAF